MKNQHRSFSARLFRLFLVSSITPAIIVTAAGYYLASQSGGFEPDSTSRANQSLARYYNDILYELISSGLDRYQTTQTFDTGLVDFLFSFKGDERFPSDLSEGITEEIRSASLSRPRGWTESEASYIQYLILPLENDTLAAGLIHGESFKSLLELVQGEHARATSQQALKTEYLFFLLVMFVTLAGGIALFTYVLSSRTSRRLAEPLVQLAQATRRISSGDFDQRVELTGDDEIRQLIESFNRMAERLGETTARLTQTERVAAWRQVARRFAHELKNPIQPILISLYQIEKKLADNIAFEQIEKPLKAATEELNHLTRLAERFSTLAKMPEVKLEPTDLTELIKSVAELYHDDNSKVALSVELSDHPLMATVDSTYLREALHNLILNGRDACRDGGSMTLSLKETDRAIIISLADSGVGMNAETVAAARLPYFSTKSHGTGLGLAIVEKSINEMNGQLKVDSKQGHGTTVSIILPLEQGSN